MYEDVDKLEMPDGKFASSAEIEELLLNFQGGETVYLRVGDNLKERRFDKYLNNRFSRFSRTLVQKLIKKGAARVNDEQVKTSHQLVHGDIITVTLPEPELKVIIPEDIPLDIIHEDEDIIVVNKQPNLIVHPARGYKSGTLVNALVHHTDQLSSGVYHFRPGIVHRLDRNTSGVIIVAKNDQAQFHLAKQFHDRLTKKTYIAITHGAPELDSDLIRTLIGTHPTKRERMTVKAADGKDAATIYKVIERFKGFSLVELDLLTGRTHQIRVHLSHIKHPIVADEMYGGKLVYPWQIKNEEAQPQEPVINRHALHAWKLEIRHPRTNEMMTFTADLPDDMQKLLDMLREYREPVTEEKVIKKRLKPHEMQ